MDDFIQGSGLRHAQIKLSRARLCLNYISSYTIACLVDCPLVPSVLKPVVWLIVPCFIERRKKVSLVTRSHCLQGLHISCSRQLTSHNASTGQYFAEKTNKLAANQVKCLRWL